MVFHRLGVYGGGRAKATADANTAVDAIFAAARGASPAIFGQSSAKADARQAKFEHLCPWVALALGGMAENEARLLLEALIDRLEVGLREAGVGDMRVGKEVRAFAGALNGRVQRYGPLISARKWDDLGGAMAEHGVDKKLAQELGRGLQPGGKWGIGG